jgi:hypothetical protein
MARRINWLNSIRDWQAEFVGTLTAREFVACVTDDLLGRGVFAFTPFGEVMRLPKARASSPAPARCAAAQGRAIQQMQHMAGWYDGMESARYYNVLAALVWVGCAVFQARIKNCWKFSNVPLQPAAYIPAWGVRCRTQLGVGHGHAC